MARPVLLALCALGVASGTSPTLPVAAQTPPAPNPQRAPAVLPAAPRGEPGLTADAVRTRTTTRDHMIAAVEMQLSGEPLAEAMERTLTGYRRSAALRDGYFDPTPGVERVTIDLPGYASAVESYEYSKQAMNSLALESTAGTALVYGPVLNARRATGLPALALLRARVLQLAGQSNATSRFVHPEIRPGNVLGWPGLWPALHPFVSFDPSIHATNQVLLRCTITSDDDQPQPLPGQPTGAQPPAAAAQTAQNAQAAQTTQNGGGARTPGVRLPLISDDYECDYGSLHLPAREAQIEPVISPGASGWGGWKYGLWAQNYLQVMHDATEAPVTHVAAAELARVGQRGNEVRGTGADDAARAPGTFLGSSDIEGFQAGLFLDMLDNLAEDLLRNLATGDGRTLRGFPDLRAALAYSTATPPRWFPTRIAVRETPDLSGFPRPRAFAITDGASDLLDSAGLLGAFATAYALTDHGNRDVGGRASARAYFDGDPFPDDNQRADGEPTLHDRALAMLRVLVVDLERLHRDPASGLLVDRARSDGAAITRGTTVSADAAAYALVSMRAARRALGSALTLYGNTTPDTAGVPTPLDALPWDGARAGETFGAHLTALIRASARLFYDKLTDASGRAYAGWDTAGARPTDDGSSLDAHTAAVRGLLAAYLSTGDTRYRHRAERVYARLEADFYDPSARIYHTRARDGATEVTFTPRRFGLLQGALRDLYELVATRPGADAQSAQLRERIARLDKLVLNGWDDRNRNDMVDWPDECVRVVNGLPRGGLQMAERTLTGESGSESEPRAASRTIGTDGDYDCVPEVSAAGLPATLAESVTFHLRAPR